MKKSGLISIIACAALCAALASCAGCSNTSQQQPMPAVQSAPAAAPAAAPQSQAAATSQPATQPQSQAAPAQATAQGQLPEAINAFIAKHFPGATVARIDPDHEYGGLEYDVTLNDGTKIDFDTNNQWKKVECYSKAVPAAFVPAAIASYVKSNYQALPITKIHKEMGGYEVELSNGLDLKFDSAGRFFGVDD